MAEPDPHPNHFVDVLKAPGGPQLEKEAWECLGQAATIGEAIRVWSQAERFDSAFAATAWVLGMRRALIWGWRWLGQQPLEPETPAAALWGKVGRWLKQPPDHAERHEIHNQAQQLGIDHPIGLLAMAVFFSGGSLNTPDLDPVEPPPGVALKMIAGAVRIACVPGPPETVLERFRSAIEAGLALAQQPNPPVDSTG